MPFVVTIKETVSQGGQSVEKTLTADFQPGEYTLDQSAWVVVRDENGDEYKLEFVTVTLSGPYERYPSWRNIISPASVEAQPILKEHACRWGVPPRKTDVVAQQYLYCDRPARRSFTTGDYVTIESANQVGRLEMRSWVIIDVGYN